MAVRIGTPRARARTHAGRREGPGRRDRHRRRRRARPREQGRRPVRRQHSGRAAVRVPRGNDDYGHGTAVASLIAAAVRRRLRDGRLRRGGARGRRPRGAHGSFTDSDVAFGLAKLDELGVRIVNLSLGGSYPSSPILVDAIHKAAADGMLIVAAAGNEGGNVSWPGADLQPGDGGRSYGLAVGATNDDGSLASFSNSGTHLSLVAPGTSPATARACSSRCRTRTCSSDNCYPQWTGAGGASTATSPARPSRRPRWRASRRSSGRHGPELKNYQVADIIKQSAGPPPARRGPGRSAAAMLDAGSRGRAGAQPLGRRVGAEPKRRARSRAPSTGAILPQWPREDDARRSRSARSRTGRSPIRTSVSTRQRRPACRSSSRRTAVAPCAATSCT